MYLTKDDSTGAATANLIPVRNATGDIIVNATPQSATAAASKTYVDYNVNPSYYVNNLFSTSVTLWSSPLLMNLTSSNVAEGWTTTGSNYTWTPNMTGVDLAVSSSAGEIEIYKNLTRDNDCTNYAFNDSKAIIVKFGFSHFSTSIYARYAWGLGSWMSCTFGLSTSTVGEAYKFCWDGTNLIAATNSNAGGYTNTTITGINSSSINEYQVVVDPGVSAKYYINGNLQATHTTGLPATTDIVRIQVYAWHQSDGGVSTGPAHCFVTNGIISQEL